MANPRIYVAITPKLYSGLFDEKADQLLKSSGQVEFNPSEAKVTSEDLAKKIGDYEAVVTGWGTPMFTPEVLAASKKLKLIAHSAGTVKHFLPEAVFEKGIAVTHAAAALATAVSDFSLLLTMTMLRRSYELHENMRKGVWQRFETGHEITGTRVGVIAASYTGRLYIKLLNGVGAEVWVYDPYLNEARAAELGVKKAGLDELLSSCKVVSMQAPTTNETKKMLGARELALMKDGSILINTARSAMIDYAALLKELQSGRISAALDVFDDEPLPKDNPFMKLPNVVLTPHVAGASVESRRRQGTYMAEEVHRFFKGEPLKFGIKREMLATMA